MSTITIIGSRRPPPPPPTEGSSATLLDAQVWDIDDATAEAADEILTDAEPGENIAMISRVDLIPDGATGSYWEWRVDDAGIEAVKEMLAA